MKPTYCDNEFAPMAPGETATPVSRNKPKYTKSRSAANAYPKDSVPKETGWDSYDASISRLPGHNKIMVCRGRKPSERYGRG